MDIELLHTLPRLLNTPGRLRKTLVWVRSASEWLLIVLVRFLDTFERVPDMPHSLLKPSESVPSASDSSLQGHRSSPGYETKQMAGFVHLETQVVFCLAAGSKIKHFGCARRGLLTPCHASTFP